jgi:hypothetical protein
VRGHARPSQEVKEVKEPPEPIEPRLRRAGGAAAGNRYLDREAFSARNLHVPHIVME